MSKKFRLEVGAQGLNSMIHVLKTDQTDSEIISYVLETLANIFCPDEFEEEVIPEKERDDFTGVGEGFSEMFLKHEENLPILLEFLEEFDFKIRRPTIAAMNSLLTNCPRVIQQQILNSHAGISRLMDVLGDTREVLRNDALILLFKLTKGNSNIQKIVAFENAFDKLVEIMEFEGWTDGGIVVEDCLRLLLNLLRNNPSNQTLFKEGSYISRLIPALGNPEDEEFGWDAQKVSNMLHILQLIRTLVAPTNPQQITTSCQHACRQSGVLGELEEVLLASGIPADVLTEAINTIADLIRGNNENQDQFSSVVAPMEPARPVLVLLLISMVNDKQPFLLRCSVLYCVQSYLYKNQIGQNSIVDALLPQELENNAGEVSSGQLLCGGLFSNDPISNWLCSVAVAQVISESAQLKEELLRVQLATQGGTAPMSLLVQSMNLIQHNASITTRLGLLQLICVWVSNCPPAVTCLLQVEGSVNFLMAQICSNEHDDTEKVANGLCAFLLGLCILYNNNTVAGSGQEDLVTLVEKRVGADTFLDKIGDMPKHEGFNKALKSPQLRCSSINELIVDNLFCQLFRSLDNDITTVIVNRKAASLLNGNPQIDASAQSAIENYKAFIRDQDQKIKDYVEANIQYDAEYKRLQAQYEEVNKNLQLLRDQNAILQAQAINSANAVGNAAHSLDGTGQVQQLTQSAELVQEIESLKKEVINQDEYIQELEARLNEETPPSAAPVVNANLQTKEAGSQTAEALTNEMLRNQLDVLRALIMKKDTELLKFKNSMPLHSPKERDRFEDMFKTSLELEAEKRAKASDVKLNNEIKEKEIERLKQMHQFELDELAKERDRTEAELYKVNHEMEDAKDYGNKKSQETISKLESEVIWLRAELDEVKQSKNNALEVPIAAPTAPANNVDIERLTEELSVSKVALEDLRSEQEDLLVMLSDQEEKMTKYKSQLRGLQVPVSDDENGEDDLT